MRRAPARSLACAALLAGCGGGDSKSSDSGDATKTTTTRVQVLEQSADGERRSGFDPRAIYRDEAPGVVTVISLFGGAGLDSILGGQNDDGSGGVGSGFVVSRNGEIATNAHVVTTGEGDDDPPRARRSTSSSPTATRSRRRSSATTPTPTSRC